MPNLFITGNSSGIGLALTEAYLEKGWQVYGLSRKGCTLQHENLRDIQADLEDTDAVAGVLDSLLGKTERLDLVILNAGVLGGIKDLHDTSQDEIETVMRINVWANKKILDWFITTGAGVDQLVMISSGAAIHGKRGWGVYALSKTTLKMLAELYAWEMPATHIISLAPGMVHTPMQDYLLDPEMVNEEEFPSVKVMRAAIGTDAMPEPDVIAARIVALIPDLKKYTSGGFVDIRDL